jgi:hypothetical protein
MAALGGRLEVVAARLGSLVLALRTEQAVKLLGPQESGANAEASSKSTRTDRISP